MPVGPLRSWTSRIHQRSRRFNYFAYEQLDAESPDDDGDEDPDVRVRDWLQSGSPGWYHHTNLTTVLDNTTTVDQDLSFALPSMCVMDSKVYIDVRASVDAQIDTSPADGEPDHPPHLLTQVLGSNFIDNATPSSSTETSTSHEEGGHHTLECRTDDGQWLERMWTDHPTPSDPDSQDTFGKVADEGTTPDWTGAGTTTTFASSADVEDHGVEAFFAVSGNRKRVAVWHLESSGGNDAIRVSFQAWDATSDDWSTVVSAYSLTGTAGHHYNWPTVAVYDLADEVRIAAEDETSGRIVLWACSGSNLVTACDTNSTTKWTTNAVALGDAPTGGRTDQDPVLAVDASGEWFLAGQRISGPEFSDQDELIFLSDCGGGWDSTWYTDFWPQNGSGPTAISVPAHAMTRLAYRQLKGWHQLVVDPDAARVDIGYVLDDSSSSSFDYEFWWASRPLSELCGG